VRVNFRPRLALLAASLTVGAAPQVLAAPDSTPGTAEQAAQVQEPAREHKQPWRGPLEVENERPLQSAFLFARPQTPDVLARGEHKFGLQLDVANDLLLPRDSSSGARVQEDFETQRGRLTVARGLGSSAQIEFEARLSARNGGILDGQISAYHRLLGLPAVGRDNPRGRGFYPNGRSIFFFRDANGNGIDEGSAIGLGDSLVTLKKQISQGRAPIAARALLKLPTGSASRVLGSGGFDAGLNLDARLPLASRVALNASMGAFAWGSSDIPNARRGGASGSLALEYRGRRTSIVAQTLAEARAVRTGVSFADRAPVIVSVGFKRDVGRGKMLWACFSENGDYQNYSAPFFGSIGPDYSLSVGFEVRR